jgi:hypothetical protein
VLGQAQAKKAIFFTKVGKKKRIYSNPFSLNIEQRCSSNEKLKMPSDQARLLKRMTCLAIFHVLHTGETRRHKSTRENTSAAHARILLDYDPALEY